MATVAQVAQGIATFISNDMLAKAEGNYRIILRTIKASIGSEIITNKIVSNPAAQMFIDAESGQVDVDALESILTEGLENNEFELKFKLFGTEYKMYITADDVHKLKTYIERATV